MQNCRPSFRVPAAWLTVVQSDGAVAYFELDEMGDLVLTNGVVVPHHIDPCESQKIEKCDVVLDKNNLVRN